jgi:hypothetical protein
LAGAIVSVVMVRTPVRREARTSADPPIAASPALDEAA